VVDGGLGALDGGLHEHGLEHGEHRRRVLPLHWHHGVAQEVHAQRAHAALGEALRQGAAQALVASEMTSCTRAARGPQARQKSSQKAWSRWRDSDAEDAFLAGVADRDGDHTAWLTMRPPSRTFWYVASNQTYG